MLHNLSELEKRGTTVRKEGIAGVTTFLTMAYIIFVNPAYATAPAILYVAVLMMPLTFSIAEGIALGFISYVAVKFLCGQRNEVTQPVWRC